LQSPAAGNGDDVDVDDDDDEDDDVDGADYGHANADGGYGGGTYLLTPWSRVLLEKLTGFQLVKNSLHFMETEGSLPHSQVPTTCPCPQPARNSPYPTSYFLKSHVNIILPSTPGSPKWSLSIRFPH